MLAKARRAALLGAGILICASGAVIDSAMAQVFRVQLTGTFTSAEESPPLIAPGTPFVASFLVNTNAAPVLHQNDQGLSLTGYADAAISGLSVTAGGVTFTQANISDSVAIAGAPGAAVFFSQDLSNGATPSITMALANGDGRLEIGEIGCGSTCQFSNWLEFEGFASEAFDTGIVSAQVTGFAGTPGAPGCHDQSVSALAKQFRSIKAAAAALAYPSVQALQDDITMFCGN